MSQTGLEDRFWSKVNKTDTCWLWTATKTHGGYGLVKANGRQGVVHRMAWELTNGPIPSGLLVCHRCDVRNCVRPDHLFLGTAKENTQDMLAKGRRPPFTGERVTQCKYGHPRTAEDFLRVRKPNSTGTCRVCRRERDKRRREANKVKKATP